MPRCWLVSSGTAALIVALKALRALEPRRAEVVIPAYCCPNVLAAVVLAGAAPVLCDIGAQGAGYDERQLERLVGPQTLAVVVVHLLGVASETDAVIRLARSHGAYVVEDAAQAFGNEIVVNRAGAEGRRRRLGTLADVGVFSFGRGKPLTLGAGGALVTASAEVARAVEAQVAGLAVADSRKDTARALLYGAFFNPALYWLPRSLPFLHLGETHFSLTVRLARMSGFCAALGARLLPHYHSALEARRAQGERLMSRLADGQAAWPLARLGEGQAYLRLPLRVEAGRRRALLARLGRLGATGMYPLPLSRQPGAALYLGRQAADIYPNAERLSQELLTLPLHGLLTEADLRALEEALHGTTPAPVAEPV